MFKECAEENNVLVHNPVVDVVHVASQRSHGIELIFFFALVSGGGANQVLSRPADGLIHWPAILGVLRQARCS